MNADGRALFAAICADPEDDVPRRVYADWLDDEGDAPRALALRMSVERRRLPDWEPRAWLLDARLIRLHSRHHEEWDAALPGLAQCRWSSGRSGLVEHVKVDSPRALLEQEGAIFLAGPIASMNVGIGLGDDHHGAAPLASCQSMARVRSLALDGMVAPERLDLPALAASPYFAGLHRLERLGCGDSDDFLHYLAECSPFPSLDTLRLYRARFSPAGCAALVRSPLIHTLRRVDVDFSLTDDACLRHLMRAPSFDQLRDLRLPENSLTPRPFRGFFALDWRHLECLDLSGNALDAATVRHLVECPRLGGLRWLDLSDSLRPFGDAGAKTLARSPDLDRLRVLVFGFNALTSDGLAALARAEWAPHLARLELAGTELGPEGVAALASPAFAGLRWLDLSLGSITDAQIPRLLDIPWLPRLTHLILNNNAIRADGARLLAAAPLDAIEWLDLTANEIPTAEREMLGSRFGDRVRLRTSWDG